MASLRMRASSVGRAIREVPESAIASQPPSQTCRQTAGQIRSDQVISGRIRSDQVRTWVRRVSECSESEEFVNLSGRHARGSRKWIPGSDPMDLYPGCVSIIDPSFPFPEDPLRS